MSLTTEPKRGLKRVPITSKLFPEALVPSSVVRLPKIPVSPKELKNQFAFLEFGSNLLSQDVSECLLKLLNALDLKIHCNMRKKKRSCTMIK